MKWESTNEQGRIHGHKQNKAMLLPTTYVKE